ncbi:ankyrin repeat-containing domain protein [Xylariaceae sp. FL1019]|nr:ankyrin repeat-containing domain protein [Xylariaceae sp. FL1019]
MAEISSTMTTLVHLPPEVQGEIAQNLDICDLARLSSVARPLHPIFDTLLYRAVRDDTDILCSLIDRGAPIKSIEKLLSSGANPSSAIIEHFPAPDHPPPHGPGAQTGSQTVGNPHALQDYQTQLMLLEAQNKRRLLWHRQGYTEAHVGAAHIRKQYTALHIAARDGNKDLIDLLVRYGADVNALSWAFCNCYGWLKPLHTALCCGQVLASYMGQMHILNLLVHREGMDIDIQDHNGKSSLAYAFENGQWLAFDWLLQMGANIEAKPEPSRTILLYACQTGRFQDAISLIGIGADVSYVCPSDGMTALHLACYYKPLVPHPQTGYQAELVKLLINKGCDVNMGDRFQNYPLCLAAAKGLADIVEILLAHGASLESRNSRGNTALMEAVIVSDSRLLHTSTINLLVRSGASITAKNNAAEDSLCLLCRRDGSHPVRDDSDPELVCLIKLLLSHVKSTNPEYLLDGSLVCSLFMNGYFESARFISSHSTSPSRYQLWAMIHQSVKDSNADELCFVLSYDAAKQCLKPKRLLLYKEIKTGKQRVAEVLLENNAPYGIYKIIPFCFLVHHFSDRSMLICVVEHVDKNGWTALHHACKHGFTDIVRGLLGRGLDPYSTTKTGESAIAIATKQRHLDLAAELRRSPVVVEMKESPDVMTVEKQ